MFKWKMEIKKVGGLVDKEYEEVKKEKRIQEKKEQE